MGKKDIIKLRFFFFWWGGLLTLRFRWICNDTRDINNFSYLCLWWLAPKNVVLLYNFCYSGVFFVYFSELVTTTPSPSTPSAVTTTTPVHVYVFTWTPSVRTYTPRREYHSSESIVCVLKKPTTRWHCVSGFKFRSRTNWQLHACLFFK